ncbi:16S rRNA (guanine(966)-N(2))-methyltransferase RsmD [uncultured Desulfovibrio sp.]|uniref:16S rRNA (guanine(966)-N(2))-methyltransferase RsmD n=1 Tax=uncultured Desulfovibrio sp. TaxID=167968 RepID=UPI00260BDE5C|nr:16S rRNA (guanine(966)-N(2))-methyltransferase RsmD [uncultured Desulfovibrio sp.]
MRIIAGTLGGRRLRTVEGEGYRPAMGKTREALFSMLLSRGLDWDGLRVLDLFAGSGSLAFECLSRGAAEALLVENALPAVKCLLRNIEDLGLTDRAHLVRDDVRKVLLRPPHYPYGLVFLDPPYRKNLCNMALTGLVERGWLASGAMVCAEVELGAPVSAPPQLELLTERTFGQTRIILWTLAA